MSFASGTLVSAGLSASVGTTNIITLADAGLYRVQYNIYTTTAGSAGTVLVTINWNDGSAKSFLSATASLSVVTLAGSVGGIQLLHSAVNQAISYSTTVVGNVGGVYTLELYVEKIF